MKITKDLKTNVLPEVNLSDFALFLSVMKEKEAYRCVLSIILGESDLELADVKVERVILNKSGKRAIRLDAWASDYKNRQFAVEMQNSSTEDFIPKRARFYQSLLDSPILKSGRAAKYKNLPSTAIIFITQEDIFGKDLAQYTFLERCEEVEELYLEDGTKKLFLNMTSKNGSDELVSLLQYMKDTKLDNPEIVVQDERIKILDSIVREVRESQEWEETNMNILEYGMEQGREQGREQGIMLNIIELVQKKVAKKKEVMEIAEALESDPELIKTICELIDAHPSADGMEIYQLLNNSPDRQNSEPIRP